MTRFKTLLIDPPWPPHANEPYDCMTLDGIAKLPVKELAEADSRLFLWTTNRFVPAAYAIALAWGFRPLNLLTWSKPPGVFGGDIVQSSEFLLYCKRGTPNRVGSQVRRTVFGYPEKNETGKTEWQRGPHSQKPDGSYGLIESMSEGPRVELFARRQMSGWDVWGNQIDSTIRWTGTVWEANPERGPQTFVVPAA